MSSFLWIEDFEGQQFREFAYRLFGKALHLDAADIPDEEIELREFMANHHVHVATTYVEGVRLIQSRLNDFDYFVVDIDLELTGEDSAQDMKDVEPLLVKWHGYFSGGHDPEDSLNSARIAMKKVAGYHLWIELVTQLGVTRDRLLFASNHADCLKSIYESFGRAYIDMPLTFSKENAKGSEWICASRNNEYATFRRGVILACSELRRANSTFRLRRKPDSPGQFTQDDGNRLLETLPLVLPNANLGGSQRKVVFRLFVRTLTQNWDSSFDIVGMDKDLSPGEFQHRWAFRNPIHLSRNWTSHDANALSHLDIKDATFLFLITFRVFFNLPPNLIQEYEWRLFSLLDDYRSLNMEKLLVDYEDTYEYIANKYIRPGVEPEKFLNKMVEQLQRNQDLDHHEDGRLLRMVFWHQLHRKDGKGNFRPFTQDFQGTDFLKELTGRLYCEGF
jgi:hypothetical protein